MPKQKNLLIRTMRSIATTSHAFDNLPAPFALTACLNYMRKHNKALCFIFIKIICSPSYSYLSYENLAPLCFYSEKSVRNNCKNFIVNFCIEYSYFKELSHTLLIGRLKEYLSNSFLCQNIPSLNAISVDDIAEAISKQGDEQQSLSILAEFEELTEQDIERVLNEYAQQMQDGGALLRRHPVKD